ncbi:hypothetical protein SS02_17315 [Enterobacter hormaechei subsp. steigerwaltii]|nr:hypothetical protein SS02_17315 [Enterobacter hormaechei subsp. steigerwaltii]
MNSSQRARRSSLERKKTCRFSSSARRVSSRLAGQGEANARYQHLTRRISLFAGFRQRNLRIGDEGQAVFFTVKTVAQIPQLRAAGRYRQVQTLCIGEFIRLFEGFRSADLLLVNMRVSPFIELNEPSI